MLIGVDGEYIDAGFSGSKASRPALDRLMTDAAQRKFDCIALYKVNRFGRSVLNLNQQLPALSGYRVRFIDGRPARSYESDFLGFRPGHH